MIRGATLLSMVGGALLAVFVFALKYEVQNLEHEFVQLNRSIDSERQAIHVLTAEWSHLNEPRRLRSLARDQLGLEPVGVGSLGTVEDVPLRDPADAILGDPGAGPPGEASFDGETPEEQFLQIRAAIAEMKTGEGGE